MGEERGQLDDRWNGRCHGDGGMSKGRLRFSRKVEPQRTAPLREATELLSLLPMAHPRLCRGLTSGAAVAGLGEHLNCGRDGVCNERRPVKGQCQLKLM